MRRLLPLLVLALSAALDRDVRGAGDADRPDLLDVDLTRIKLTRKRIERR